MPSSSTRSSRSSRVAGGRVHVPVSHYAGFLAAFEGHPFDDLLYAIQAFAPSPTPTSDAGSPAQGPPWQLIVASFIAVTALAGLSVLRRILSKPA